MMGVNEIMSSREIELACPNEDEGCRGKVKVSLNQIRHGKTVTCPRCGLRINLREKGNEISKVEKSLRDFGKSLDRMSNIKIKL